MLQMSEQLQILLRVASFSHIYHSYQSANYLFEVWEELWFKCWYRWNQLLVQTWSDSGSIPPETRSAEAGSKPMQPDKYIVWSTITAWLLYTSKYHRLQCPVVIATNFSSVRSNQHCIRYFIT